MQLAAVSGLGCGHYSECALSQWFVVESTLLTRSALSSHLWFHTIPHGDTPQEGQLASLAESIVFLRMLGLCLHKVS